MSKRKAHQNVHGTGGSKQYVPVDRKLNERLRKPSTDAGAAIVDAPFYFILFTGVCLLIAGAAKIIF